jgi:hypothetical protein
MKTQRITFSKTEAIIKCCIAATIIALLVSLTGKIDLHQFMMNIMDWDTI